MSLLNVKKSAIENNEEEISLRKNVYSITLLHKNLLHLIFVESKRQKRAGWRQSVNTPVRDSEPCHAIRCAKYLEWTSNCQMNCRLTCSAGLVTTAHVESQPLWPDINNLQNRKEPPHFSYHPAPWSCIYEPGLWFRLPESKRAVSRQFSCYKFWKHIKTTRNEEWSRAMLQEMSSSTYKTDSYLEPNEGWWARQWSKKSPEMVTSPKETLQTAIQVLKAPFTNQCMSRNLHPANDAYGNAVMNILHSPAPLTARQYHIKVVSITGNDYYHWPFIRSIIDPRCPQSIASTA